MSFPYMVTLCGQHVFPYMVISCDQNVFLIWLHYVICLYFPYMVISGDQQAGPQLTKSLQTK